MLPRYLANSFQKCIFIKIYSIHSLGYAEIFRNQHLDLSDGNPTPRPLTIPTPAPPVISQISFLPLCIAYCKVNSLYPKPLTGSR